MTDNHLFQTHSKDIAPIALLADCTFSSKANKEYFMDFKDPKATLEVELNLLKEQHRKTLLDLSRSHSQNKDLKAEIVQLGAILQQKDQEINDLRSQLDLKGRPSSRKLQEIDMNLPRLPIKSSMDENVLSGKYLRSMVDYENAVKKLNSQNKSLKKDVERLMEKLRKVEEEKAKDSSNSSDGYFKMAQDLLGQCKVVEATNDSLIKENEQLRDRVEKLEGEASHLKKDNLIIKRMYDDLKSRYECLEITATSNKADNSTESGANSESTGGSKDVPNSKRSLKKDVKWNLEGMNITLHPRDSPVDLSLEEYKKIVTEIMEVYHVKSPLEVIPSIKKMQKVVQMVPKLRKLVSDIADLVFPRVGYSKDKGEIELILPSLKKIFKELDEVEVLISLRNKLIDLFQLDKDCPNVDIIKKADKLATLYYCETRTQSGEAREGLEDSLLSAQFTKIFGAQPSTAMFRQISKQLEDFKYFISVVKHKLKIELDVKSENWLNPLLKMIENVVKDKQVSEIMYKLQNLLNCGLDSLVYNIERMVLEKKKEKL